MGQWMCTCLWEQCTGENWEETEAGVHSPSEEKVELKNDFFPHNWMHFTNGSWKIPASWAEYQSKKSLYP